MSNDDLLDDLAAAERANCFSASCQACAALAEAPEEVRPALESALGGTIGNEKLSKILRRHGYTVGRRAIIRHRTEGHSA